MAAAFALLGSARAASALEPRSLTEPGVLQQPATVTNVVDAFDEGSGVDLHFSLGYQHTWKRAGISRETRASLLGTEPGTEPSAALIAARGGTARFHVADFSVCIMIWR